MSIWIIFKLLGSLALLMFGMKSMSEALQKMAGPQLRHVLGAMTTNRFTGMLTGMLVTASVQSSTATTVMTVSFVNAGLLTLAQAISVIMGANIGTTLTAWIMSAGMSFDITSAVYPAFFMGIILIYLKKYRYIGDFLFGLSFLLLGLGTLRMTGTEMHLGENQALLNFFASFDPTSFTTTLIFLLLGGIMTFCVQSSAAVMAITMILCSSGALPIYQGIALVMGENIGTTVTSNLAAMTASTQARRAAFAHMFFNFFGVCWILLVFHPFVDFVCLGGGVDKLSFVLATFHTCFNIVNTFILIWFIPQIERIVCWVIKSKGGESGKQEVRLQYLDAGPMQAPEIAVLQAQKEVQLFGQRVQQMFQMVRQLLDEQDMNQFNHLFTQIENEEDATDQIEIEIAKYLEHVSDEHLSDETKQKIRQMMREISELESIGDACYNLARTLNRKQESGKNFTPEQSQQIDKMIALVDAALVQMNVVMGGHRHEHDIRETFRIENDINQLRQQLKADNIQAVNNHDYDYTVGTLYIDLINGCEKLGDYIVNVVEARFGK